MLQYILKPCKIFLAALVILVFAVGAAQAAVYNLCADEALMTMPDGQQVTVWGFGLDTGGACPVSVPGPTLSVDPTDPVLTVNPVSYTHLTLPTNREV